MEGRWGERGEGRRQGEGYGDMEVGEGLGREAGRGVWRWERDWRREGGRVREGGSGDAKRKRRLTIVVPAGDGSLRDSSRVDQATTTAYHPSHVPSIRLWLSWEHGYHRDNHMTPTHRSVDCYF